MDTQTLFQQHITELQQGWNAALQNTQPGCDAILIHSGSSHNYFADDHAPPFKAWGHFLRWAPVDRPDQFVLLVPGHKPRLLALVPRDFWHDQSLETERWWADCLDITFMENLSELATHLPGVTTLVFLGENQKLAADLGIPAQQINPASLLSWLDYDRAVKTDYEIGRLRQANAHALLGHGAAEQTFRDGGDEYDIHHAYLAACQVLDQELPYSNIIALNEKAAILHYQNKRRYLNSAGKPPNNVLLIDAGCRAYGYCSDITRTWAAEDAHPVFHELLKRMQALQASLVDSVVPGVSFADLHRKAHLGVAQLLTDTSICYGNPGTLVDDGTSTLFFPHGLGHLLGLQVHDVGGRLANRSGDIAPPPEQWPGLRNTRTLDAGAVVTIEPGLYFIPALLEPARSTTAAKSINWTLVEELIPFGGIRIEDNVLTTDEGADNLTRNVA
ncbi:MAG: Xaa-Pro dipeptidase [Pseudohongiella sp.]|uniref:Xaa-Pro dipeptidase n=1 Tax=Pseudohongiella sp. TaxID=1979412 RepID=UPI0034A03DF2